MILAVVVLIVAYMFAVAGYRRARRFEIKFRRNLLGLPPGFWGTLCFCFGIFGLLATNLAAWVARRGGATVQPYVLPPHIVMHSTPPVQTGPPPGVFPPPAPHSAFPPPAPARFPAAAPIAPPAAATPLRNPFDRSSVGSDEFRPRR